MKNYGWKFGYGTINALLNQILAKIAVNQGIADLFNRIICITILVSEVKSKVLMCQGLQFFKQAMYVWWIKYFI
jgi:hypothetical protein